MSHTPNIRIAKMGDIYTRHTVHAHLDLLEINVRPHVEKINLDLTVQFHVQHHPLTAKVWHPVPLNMVAHVSQDIMAVNVHKSVNKDTMVSIANNVVKKGANLDAIFTQESVESILERSTYLSQRVRI